LRAGRLCGGGGELCLGKPAAVDRGGGGRVDGRRFLDRRQCLLQAGARRRRWRW
jgi:hypothetical protein